MKHALRLMEEIRTGVQPLWTPMEIITRGSLATVSWKFAKTQSTKQNTRNVLRPQMKVLKAKVGVPQLLVRIRHSLVGGTARTQSVKMLPLLLQHHQQLLHQIQQQQPQMQHQMQKLLVAFRALSREFFPALSHALAPWISSVVPSPS